jgi:hypothetical protein
MRRLGPPGPKLPGVILGARAPQPFCRNAGGGDDDPAGKSYRYLALTLPMNGLDAAFNFRVAEDNRPKFLGGAPKPLAVPALCKMVALS